MEEKLNSVLEKLCGSVRVPEDFDYKTELHRVLEEKYVGKPGLADVLNPDDRASREHNVEKGE